MSIDLMCRVLGARDPGSMRGRRGHRDRELSDAWLLDRSLRSTATTAASMAPRASGRAADGAQSRQRLIHEWRRLQHEHRAARYRLGREGAA